MERTENRQNSFLLPDHFCLPLKYFYLKFKLKNEDVSFDRQQCFYNLPVGQTRTQLSEPNGRRVDGGMGDKWDENYAN